MMGSYWASTEWILRCRIFEITLNHLHLTLHLASLSVGLPSVRRLPSSVRTAEQQSLSLVLTLAAAASQVGHDSLCVIGLLDGILLEQPSKNDRAHAQDAQPRGSGSKTSNVPRGIRLRPKPCCVD